MTNTRKQAARAESEPSSAPALGIADFGDQIRQLLAQHRDARVQLYNAKGQEATDSALAAEFAARQQLHGYVVAMAGPVPSAIQCQDGTLIVAGMDEYYEVPEGPVLTIVEPVRVASPQASLESCGYCNGAGRVPGPRYDRDGRRRDDWPDTITCEYCGGSGECEEGSKLLAARRPTED